MMLSEVRGQRTENRSQKNRNLSSVFSPLSSVLCLLSSVFCLFLSGCGYTAKSLLPSDINTIYVKTFANKIDITLETSDTKRLPTYRPLLEVDITEAVINRFLFDGTLNIEDNPELADAVLIGELIDFRQDPLRYDSSGNVDEYRLSLVVTLQLLKRDNNEVIWKEEKFIGDTTYFAQGSGKESEETALDRAISDLARRVVERVVEVW